MELLFCSYWGKKKKCLIGSFDFDIQRDHRLPFPKRCLRAPYQMNARDKNPKFSLKLCHVAPMTSSVGSPTDEAVLSRKVKVGAELHLAGPALHPLLLDV